MDEVIRNICEALKEEAELVKSYTDKLKSTPQIAGAEGAYRTLAISRLDAVEQIQNLTLELTALVFGTSIEKAGGSDE